MNVKDKQATKESGNVLFLILIAVALFAALSYAVTQSTRSGGGDASGETALIGSAQVTQYPASIRTALMRMIISGEDIGTLEFNNESLADNFADCTSGNARCVFHPSGGGATHMNASVDVMADGNPGTWVFNGENEINLIGTTSATEDSPTATTAEIIAFLPGLKEAICSKINSELGITGIPTDTGVDFATQMTNPNGSTSTSMVSGASTATIGGTTAGASGLDGQPFGCFQDSATSAYVYYHVLADQ